MSSRQKLPGDLVLVLTGDDIILGNAVGLGDLFDRLGVPWARLVGRHGKRRSRRARP